MENQFTTLYIIGNGFDLAHDIKSSYCDFKLWLEQNHKVYFNQFENFYDPSDEQWWTQFEKNLAVISDEYITECVDQVIENFNDNELAYAVFSEESDDVTLGSDELSDEFEAFFTELKLNFSSWVQQIPIADYSAKIKMEQNAHYLCFNYTNTLEEIYKIPESNILYLHGKSQRNDQLVIGHNIDSIYCDAGASYGRPQWLENTPVELDGCIEQGKETLKEELTKLRKNTRNIIKENRLFFESLKNASKIVVIGHSLNDIDKPYFEELIRGIDKNNVQWNVSYHESGEDAHHKKFLVSQEIPEKNISLFKLD